MKVRKFGFIYVLIFILLQSSPICFAQDTISPSESDDGNWSIVKISESEVHIIGYKGPYVDTLYMPTTVKFLGKIYNVTKFGTDASISWDWREPRLFGLGTCRVFVDNTDIPYLPYSTMFSYYDNGSLRWSSQTLEVVRIGPNKQFTALSKTFANLPNLQEITYPIRISNDWKEPGGWGNGSGDHFLNTPKLKKVMIKGTTRFWREVFRYCSLQEIITPEGINTFDLPLTGDNLFSMFFNDTFSNSSIPYIVLNGKSNITINQWAEPCFLGWTPEQKIIFPGKIEIQREPRQTEKLFGNATVYGIPGGSLEATCNAWGNPFVPLGGVLDSAEIVENAIGDNTNLKIKISGKMGQAGILKIYAISPQKSQLVKTILLNPTSIYRFETTEQIDIQDLTTVNSINIQLCMQEDFKIFDRIIKKKGELLDFKKIDVDKQNQLQQIDDILRMKNDLPQFILLDDKERIYDQNALNNQLINQIAGQMNGIFFIQNNIPSTPLNVFLEK